MTNLPKANEFQNVTDKSEKNNTELSLLRFITCGSVDDGKSTLIGRMLFDAGQVFDDQIEALDDASQKFGTQGKERDYALLVDGLSAEREQGITIDVAYRYFRTKKRAFIVADTPGHEQYTRNMATGASTAEVAILLIDARKGILPQTRRHAKIVSMLGVKKIVLAINKMDLVEYDEKIFNQIEKNFLALSRAFNFSHIVAIPLSAKNGENILENSPNMPWYKGESLLGFLENIDTQTTNAENFHFPVQWVNRPNLDFRGFSGYVTGGEVKVGDNIRVSSSGQTSKVSRLVTYDGDLPSASSGQSITITLEDEIDISRGDILSLANDKLRPVSAFEAQILWMSSAPMLLNKEYIIKHATTQTSAKITELKSAIDINTLEQSEVSQLKMNGIAQIDIALGQKILADKYLNDCELGSFILIDRLSNETVAMGLVSGFNIAKKVDQPKSFKATLKRLLPAAENSDNIISYGLKWYPLSALLTFIIALILTRNIWIAALIAAFEFALKPLLQILHLRTLAKADYNKYTKFDDINSDGSGI